MHHNGVALHTTNRMLDTEADVADDFIHRLLLSASLWSLMRLTLTRLLVRHLNRIALIIQLDTLRASINMNLDVPTPIAIGWNLWFQHAVIMMMAAQCPTEQHHDLVRKGHARLLQRRLLFCRCHARVVCPHLVNDDKLVLWRP
jgi:hypothetical protein